MSRDERAIQQAVGYIELELHAQAIQALDSVSEAGRAAFPFHFHMYMGEGLRGVLRFQDAIPHFQAAQRENPPEIACHLALAWCYKRTGRIDMAIESLNEAKRICDLTKGEERLPLVLYNLSCYHSLAGNRDPAIQLLAEAIALDPLYRDRVADEPDFDPVRDDPEFQAILAK